MRSEFNRFSDRTLFSEYLISTGVFDDMPLNLQLLIPHNQIFFANSIISAARAIVPSSLVISQITPAGLKPLKRAKSTDAQYGHDVSKHRLLRHVMGKHVLDGEDLPVLHDLQLPL